MNVVIVKCKGLMCNDRKLWQLPILGWLPKFANLHGVSQIESICEMPNILENLTLKVACCQSRSCKGKAVTVSAELSPEYRIYAQ